MSPGRRSGVNWIRLNSSPSALAKLRATRVLPKPGKSSSRMCPPASTDAIIISRRGRLPTTARSTSTMTCLLNDETWEMSVTIYSNENFSHRVAKKALTLCVPASLWQMTNFQLRFEKLDCLINIKIKRRRLSAVCVGKLCKGHVQTGFEVVPQFRGRLPVDPNQRSKDRTRASAFTV